MKLIFFLLLLLNSTGIYCQSHTIDGDWNLVAFSTPDLYYDFKSDSLALSPAMSTKIKNSGQDSASTPQIIKQGLHFMKGYHYSFFKDMGYVIFQNNLIDKGSYKIDTSIRRVILTSTKIKGEGKRQEFQFLIENNMLTLVSTKDGDISYQFLERSSN